MTQVQKTVRLQVESISGLVELTL